MTSPSSRAEKIKQAGIARHGSEEAWRKFQSEAGKRSTGGGLAWMKIHDPERLKEISRKGGQTSVRGKAKPSEEVVE